MNIEELLSKTFPKGPASCPQQPFPPMDPQMIQQYFNLVMQQSNKPLIPPTLPPTTTSMTNVRNPINPLLQYNMFFPFLPQLQPPQLSASAPLTSVPRTPTSASSSSSSRYSIDNILSAAAAAGKISQKFHSPQPPPPTTQFQNLSPSRMQQSSPQMPDPSFLLNLLTPPCTSTSNGFRPRPTPILRVHVTRESSRPLREWMNLHIHDPYPTPNEIDELSNITGFSRKQVRDWFTNNRRRYEQKIIKNNLTLPWKKREAPKHNPI